MKTFFDSIFMDNDMLKEENKNYPIKLEYYRTKSTEENVLAKYGIEIVKTEFKYENVNVEIEKVEEITDSEEKIEEILECLRDNEVTPVCLKDVLDEFLQVC